MYIYYFQSSQVIGKKPQNTSLSLYRVNSIRPGRGGGLRSPEDKIHSCHLKTFYLNDAQTLWISGFIPKICFDQTEAKFVSQGFLLLFLIEMSKIFLKWKKFPVLETCWNWHRGKFLAEKDDFGHKTHLWKLNPFSGGKYPNSITCSLLEKEIFRLHP